MEELRTATTADEAEAAWRFCSSVKLKVWLMVGCISCSYIEGIRAAVSSAEGTTAPATLGFALFTG